MKEQILAVQRMQDYIEKTKAEAISLLDLARSSPFSPWHAFRLLRNVLGLTPNEYIRKYRLTQAAKQLRSGEVKVIAAAYNAGFTNVDTFTRAFLSSQFHFSLTLDIRPQMPHIHTRLSEKNRTQWFTRRNRNLSSGAVAPHGTALPYCIFSFMLRTCTLPV